jgi:hypothetical protein
VNANWLVGNGTCHQRDHRRHTLAAKRALRVPLQCPEAMEIERGHINASGLVEPARNLG